MASVTIEGSATPSTYLAMGDRVTVERTEFINKLIRRGYVNVVVPRTNGIVQPKPAPQVSVSPPTRRGSRDAWESFLNSQNIIYPETATRNDMIALWDATQG